MRLRFFVDKIEAKLLSPEDTHALLCVPVVEELQAGDEQKLVGCFVGRLVVLQLSHW